MKKVLRFLFAIIICAFICVSYKASTYADGNTKVVRVGYYEKEKFQEGRLGTMPKSGYGYEYLQKISYYTGWTYQYVYGDWDSLYKMLCEGKIDLMAGLTYTDSRAELMNFSSSEMGNENYYIYEKKEDADYDRNDLKLLERRKIGAVRNAQIEDQLAVWTRMKGVSLDVVFYEDYSVMRAALESNAIDGVISSDKVTLFEDELSAVSYFGEMPFYLAVAKTKVSVLRELNNAQKSLADAEPRFSDNLTYKYYGKTSVNTISVEQEDAWLGEHSKITVGFLDNYLPYCATDKNGNATGVVTNLVPAIFNVLGYDEIEIEYVSYTNYQDMFQALEDEKVDTIFPCSGDLWYAEKNGTYISDAVFINAVNLAYKDYNSSTLSKIAVNRNNLLQYYYVISNYPTAEIVWCDSTDECLKSVLNDEAGSTIMDGLRVTNILKNSEYAGLLSITLNDSAERCFGVKTGDKNLLGLINHGIDELGEEYAIGISYNYMDDLYTYSARDMLHDYAGRLALIGALVTLLILVNIHNRYKAVRKQKEIEDRRNEELSAALETAENAKNAMAAVYDSMGAAKWSVDYTVGGHITDIWLGDEMKKILGCSDAENLKELKLISMMNEKDRQRMYECFKNVMEDTKARTGLDFEYQACINGEDKWFKVLGRPALMAGGLEGRFYGLFLDITDKKKKEIAEYEAATIDSLTRLFNRNMFEEDMDEIKKLGRFLPEIVVLTVDINRLKEVNDNQGHAAGDELIQGAASVIKEVFSDYGKCYRTGGDEFVVVMRGEKIPVARLNGELTEKMAAWSGEIVKQVEISRGWASSLGNENVDIDDLLRISDRNMYVDKAEYYKRKGIDRRT